MRHRTLTAVITCVVALSTAAQSYQLALPAGKRFVLALANSAEVLRQCSRATPQGATGFWVPTEAQLDQLEAELIKQLEARTGERPPSGVAYHRQYVGFVQAGMRVIYGNYYPGGEGLFKYESERAVAVCDGGPAFWGVVYNPTFNTFRDFSFNGIT